MKIISKVTEAITIFLYLCYTSLILFSEEDWYYNAFMILAKIDTTLFNIAFLGAIFCIDNWRTNSKVCFIYIIIFNILTEIGMRIEIPNYYTIYKICVTTSLLTIIIFPKFTDNRE